MISSSWRLCFFLRWSLWRFRGPGCFERPGHLLPGERRPEGRVRRLVRPQRRADGEREGVGDAVHGYACFIVFPPEEMLLRYWFDFDFTDASTVFITCLSAYLVGSNWGSKTRVYLQFRCACQLWLYMLRNSGTIQSFKAVHKRLIRLKNTDSILFLLF